MTPLVNVIGAGLAGSEAAFQAARLGARVRLFEMKPEKKTPAHKSDGFAELVCSNSLRSADVFNAVGLLKEELHRMGSLVMESAYATRVAAGSALAVDRERFSAYITEKILENERIEVIPGEVTALPEEGITVIATGPLTSDAMSRCIREELGIESLSFFDAAAPIVSASSINMEKAFFASRYDKGDADYINCPLTEEEYRRFYDALCSAEEAELHDFDKDAQKELTVFEGCMPVEVMARRGFDTLGYGPMKPVGIRHPETGEEFFAVVQLRRENEAGTMYNLVGFQTHLTFPEQRRVFRMIPGLENAEFLRYGVMHRNTYLRSPGVLTPYYSMISRRNVYFAGQMTGVEGYIESASSGFVAGVCAARQAMGLDEIDFPRETAIGSLAHYVSEGPLSGDFQPMNANFGLIAPITERVKGGRRAKRDYMAARALAEAERIRDAFLND